MSDRDEAGADAPRTDARGTPAISVVIPTHERRELLLRALAALAAQTLGEKTYEVVVVCDGCTDGTADAVRAMQESRANLTVLEQANAGAAAARNRGARAARAPLLLFIDDDMIAEPDLLEVHLARHAQGPGTIVLGAVPVDPSSPRSFITAGLEAWAKRRNARLSAPGADVPPGDVLTGQISLARTTFEALSGFDPRFTAGGSYGGEDVEIGWRARRLGIPIVYEPRAVTHQVYDKTFPALRRDVRQAGAADVRLARLHPEIAPGLMLGQLDALSPWQRRAVRLTVTKPPLASILFAPLLAALDLAARRHLTGKLLEDLHGIARAHSYGLGMKDAGYRPGLS